MRRLLIILTITLVLSFWGQGELHSQSTIEAPSITEESKSNIRIYPNPVEDYFHIEIDAKVKYISISDIFGKQILRYQAVTGHRYSVADLRKGMYVLRIISVDEDLIKVIRLNKA